MLSDLRESGAIEQDADVVCFLYRPEYYGLDVDESGNSTKGVAEVIISKHRNGALDNIRVRFVDKFIKFVDLDEMYAPSNLTPLANIIKDNKATITRKSKMDDISEEDGSEEAPF
jgi:replicative DNA helicase